MERKKLLKISEISEEKSIKEKIDDTDNRICCRVRDTGSGKYSYGKVSRKTCKSIGGVVVDSSYCE